MIHFNSKKHKLTIKNQATHVEVIKKVNLDSSHKIYKCDCCEKAYKHRQSLHNHKKNNCTPMSNNIIKENNTLKKKQRN
jgi:hypothetical protein